MDAAPPVFRNRLGLMPVVEAQEEQSMAKPPKSTPHSDINGVHQDEKRNVDTAVEAGQGATSLARAKKEAKARPGYVGTSNGKDDRTG